MLHNVASYKTLIGHLLGFKPRYSNLYTPSLKVHHTISGNVYISFFPNAAKSVTTISADFEMAWAWRYAKSGPASATEMGLLERSNFPIFLNLFNSYNIPITWATVGHLFLSCCSNDDALPHINLPRIPYFVNNHWDYSSGDWFDHDPCTDYKKDPAWYAPDLIQQIIDSPSNHEIACHSFSHLDMTDERCPYEVARSEIELCLKIADQHGLSLRSMVFPGGTRGNYGIFKDLGFTCYRGRPKPKLEMNFPVKKSNSLWEIPTATMVGGILAQNYNHHIASWILKRYLDVACRKNLVTHFWFHPSCDETTTEILFPKLIKEIAGRRDAGETMVMTMDFLADYCETRRNASLTFTEVGFVINSNVSYPFRITSITICFDNPKINAIISESGNIYHMFSNNGIRYVEIPPSEFGLLLTYKYLPSD